MIDLRPRIQALSSNADETVVLDGSPAVTLDDITLALLDWDVIQAEMLAWKRQRGFHNLVFDLQVLQAIVAEQRYVLYAAEAAVQPARFADLPRIQGIALAILKKYTERFYMRPADVRKRNTWSINPSSAPTTTCGPTSWPTVGPATWSKSTGASRPW